MELPEPISQRFKVLALRKFQQNDLRIFWEEEYPARSSERKVEEDSFWNSRLQQNPDANFFNGTLCELRKHDFSTTPIQLILGPIEFKAHFFSVSEGESTKKDTGSSNMALGVSAVVLSGDSKLHFMKRSQDVAAGPGQLDVFGGHIDPNLHSVRIPQGDKAPDPLAAIAAELEEELNLRESQITSLEGIGLIENCITGQPELIFRCRTFLDSEAIILRARRAKDRREYSRIMHLPDEVEELRKFCLDYATEFSPSGLGNIWLHTITPD